MKYMDSVLDRQVKSKRGIPFQFIIYNDSIAVLVTNHMDVSTFIIDTFTDYELILDFVDRVPL